MRALIFGGNGSVGTNMRHILQDFGHHVTVIDRRGGKRPINLLYDADDDICEAAVKDCDVVFHFAAIPAHRLSVEQPFNIIYNNYYITLKIAEWCRKYNKKIIYASSFSVYGKQPTPWKEDMPLQGDTPYAHSKIACEELLKTYSTLYGLPVVICRFSNVFGPFEEFHEPLQVIPTWLNAEKNGEEIIVHGEDTTRDFTYVVDVCLILLKLARMDIKFDIFNICSGEEVKLSDVARKISKNVKVLPLAGHEAVRWVGDNTKIKNLGLTRLKSIFDWVNEELIRKNIRGMTYDEPSNILAMLANNRKISPEIKKQFFGG